MSGIEFFRWHFYHMVTSRPVDVYRRLHVAATVGLFCVAAHEPTVAASLSVRQTITGSTLRLILRLDSLHLRSTASRSTRICPFLLLLVLPFLLYGRSENVPSISPVSVKSARRVRGVEQHRPHRRLNT